MRGVIDPQLGLTHLVWAKYFGIGLRTFRNWIAAGHFSNGGQKFDATKVAHALWLWCVTYSWPDTKARLQIRTNPTLNRWKKHGFLVGEVVCGQERIYKEGVENILKDPRYIPGAKKMLLGAGSRGRQSQERSELIELGEAANILRLPTWQARAVLYNYIDREQRNGDFRFRKEFVEKFVFDHSDLLVKIRLGLVKP